MDNLFSHPGFRLIFIDDNGMSLITPLEHKEDVLKNGYRCISHYWGPNPPSWKSHPVKGVKWSVHVRKEKRERVLQVFNHHKGYFWMDVFCTNQDDDNKPLDVMGDIYKECKECIAMLDIICDIPGSISDASVWKAIAENMQDIIGKYDELAEKYLKYLASIEHCNWINRVWTWQETALPPKMLFCNEQAVTQVYDPFDAKFLNELFSHMFVKSIMEFDGDDHIYIYRTLLPRYLLVINPLRTIMTICERSFDIWDNVTLAFDSPRKCTKKEDYIYGIIGILNISVPIGLTLENAMVTLDIELQKRGIFIGPGRCKRLGYETLNTLFRTRRPMDGITVLGKIDDISILGKFNPNVDIMGHKRYGKILSKVKYEHRDDWLYERYKHVRYKYEMESCTIFLEHGDYSVGNTIETTKIGRKESTFKRYGSGYKRNEIFKIRGHLVEVVGYIGKNGIGQWE